MGLSNVHTLFIDNNGNKFFTDYNQVYGELIRQIQTPDGQIIDASDGDVFDQKMRELNMIEVTKNDWMIFWFAYDNMHANKFVCEVTGMFDWIKTDNDLFSKPANIYTKFNIIDGHYTDKKTIIDDYESLFN